jgi:hypothetical protein
LVGIKNTLIFALNKINYMANVYNVPNEIEVPVFDFENIEEWQRKEAEFVVKLKDWCVARMQRANVVDECVGEVIKFPVADGYAEYMVAATKPVQLIHLPLGDAWCFQYANRLTKKDIVEKVNQQKNIAKFFADRQK